MALMPKKQKQSDPPTKTSLVIPKGLWTDVKIQALREDRDAQDLVAEALAEYLKAKKGGDRR